MDEPPRLDLGDETVPVLHAVVVVESAHAAVLVRGSPEEQIMRLPCAVL